MPVVTEFVACETQGCHIGRVDYMLVIAEFIARETQDFASLLGWRRHLYIKGMLL